MKKETRDMTKLGPINRKWSEQERIFHQIKMLKWSNKSQGEYYVASFDVYE